jgi:Lrp/AsnC family transcriptional regulator, regulator for asnA, asnC and gidA
MSEKLDLDKLDFALLNILISDASPSYQEIGKKLEVSSGTIHVRIKRLIGMGVLKQNVYQIDYAKIGYDVQAYVGIYVNQNDSFDRIVKDLESINEVISVDITAGEYSIIAKIVCKSTNHLRQILTDKVHKVNGVTRSVAHISLLQAMFKPLIIEK